MRILFASSEVYPYSKTGGLADVVGALPGELAKLGHEVLVASPWYAGLSGEPVWIGDVDFPFDGGNSNAGVGTLESNGVRQAFVGHDDFRRESIYGYPDDVRRFCRFTRALPQVAARLGFAAQIAHVHDWHTAYLPLLLEKAGDLPGSISGVPSVLTIHNAQYQGISAVDETLRWLQLPAAQPAWIEYPLHGHQANALACGLRFAERVTTVSPTYARELLTPEYGYGLENTFREAQHKLEGILNGIDTDVWDPARDPHLPEVYDVNHPGGKRQAKLALCERAGLDPQKPLLAVVSRLAEQKGIDILLAAATELRNQGWSLFILGTGDAELERQVRTLQGSGILSAQLAYDEALAHLVYAGADLLAIPSRFEPCGLSQMIAMRYGTLPLARATGGLSDTVEQGETGFLFAEPGEQELLSAAAEARRCYGSPEWATMTRQAMSQDFSWKRSARSYADLYEELGVTDE